MPSSSRPNNSGDRPVVKHWWSGLKARSQPTTEQAIELTSPAPPAASSASEQKRFRPRHGGRDALFAVPLDLRALDPNAPVPKRGDLFKCDGDGVGPGGVRGLHPKLAMSRAQRLGGDGGSGNGSSGWRTPRSAMSRKSSALLRIPEAGEPGPATQPAYQPPDLSNWSSGLGSTQTKGYFGHDAKPDMRFPRDNGPAWEHRSLPTAEEDAIAEALRLTNLQAQVCPPPPAADSPRVRQAAAHYTSARAPLSSSLGKYERRGYFGHGRPRPDLRAPRAKAAEAFAEGYARAAERAASVIEVEGEEVGGKGKGKAADQSWTPPSRRSSAVEQVEAKKPMPAPSADRLESKQPTPAPAASAPPKTTVAGEDPIAGPKHTRTPSAETENVSSPPSTREGSFRDDSKMPSSRTSVLGGAEVEKGDGEKEGLGDLEVEEWGRKVMEAAKAM